MLRAYRSLRKREAHELRKAGLVPIVIADKLGISLETVCEYLRELARDGLLEPLPAWITKTTSEVE